MKGKIVAAVAISVFSSVGLTQGIDGGCGVGSMIWDGQSGFVPQTSATTTNDTLGNQTFGLSTGTLGCSTDDTVQYRGKRIGKVSFFIEENKVNLSRDMAAGGGETMETLAYLLDIKKEDQAVFMSTTKDHYANIFASTDTGEVVVNLRRVLANNAELSAYSDIL